MNEENNDPQVAGPNPVQMNGDGHIGQANAHYILETMNAMFSRFEARVGDELSSIHKGMDGIHTRIDDISRRVDKNQEEMNKKFSELENASGAPEIPNRNFPNHSSFQEATPNRPEGQLDQAYERRVNGICI